MFNRVLKPSCFMVMPFAGDIAKARELAAPATKATRSERLEPLQAAVPNG